MYVTVLKMARSNERYKEAVTNIAVESKQNMDCSEKHEFKYAETIVS